MYIRMRLSQQTCRHVRPGLRSERCGEQRSGAVKASPNLHGPDEKEDVIRVYPAVMLPHES